MWKLIDGYIGRNILGMTILTLGILSSISSLFRFIEQLKSVGKGNYDMVHAALYTLFSIPRDLEIFFPMAALIGGLLALGMMASHSELVVLQASGFSKLNIFFSMMKTAIILMLIVFAVGEWLAPVAESAAKELRAKAISGGSVISSQQGVWTKDKKAFISIGEVEEKGTLNDVRIYQFGDTFDELEQVTTATRARFVQNYWRMFDVTHLKFEKNFVEKQFEAEYLWKSDITPDTLGVVSTKPEELSLTGLMEYVDYLEKNNQNVARFELAMWRKIFQPISIGVMLLVALSFIFGPLRSMTMAARVLMGIVTGFLFYIADQIFGPVSVVYQLPPMVGAIIPSMGFAMMALYLLNRRT